mmetsp:Transcript_48019/g.150859  ORF Transcript_48019/g.150859 Transcript_48019/m.150859 type:complete len:277 (+) Transcript_48019:670-1500(+)
MYAKYGIRATVSRNQKRWIGRSSKTTSMNQHKTSYATLTGGGVGTSGRARSRSITASLLSTSEGTKLGTWRRGNAPPRRAARCSCFSSNMKFFAASFSAGNGRSSISSPPTYVVPGVNSEIGMYSALFRLRVGSWAVSASSPATLPAAPKLPATPSFSAMTASVISSPSTAATASPSSATAPPPSCVDKRTSGTASIDSRPDITFAVATAAIPPISCLACSRSGMSTATSGIRSPPRPNAKTIPTARPKRPHCSQSAPSWRPRALGSAGPGSLAGT